MNLYIIRHGQSEANRNGIMSGWLQTPLSERGKEQARKTGEFLREIPFDKVFVSDRIRAIETLELALPGTPAVEEPLLREISLGKLEGMPIEEFYQKYGKEEGSKSRNLQDYSPYGGESPYQQIDRVKEFLAKLEAEPCENVAAFAHFGIMCRMLDIVVGKHLPKDALVCTNAAVSVFAFVNGKWRIKLWNYTGSIW